MNRFNTFYNRDHKASITLKDTMKLLEILGTEISFPFNGNTSSEKNAVEGGELGNYATDIQVNKTTEIKSRMKFKIKDTQVYNTTFLLHVMVCKHN
jgi:hypothetical protein